MSTTPRSESDIGEHLSSEQYHAVLAQFAERKHGSLFVGSHYEALSRLLHADDDARRVGSEARGHEPSFITVHESTSAAASGQHLQPHERIARSRAWSASRSRERRIRDVPNDATLEQLAALRPDAATGNRLVFLRGYPDRPLLTRLGAALNLDYEFLFQHFSDPRRLTSKTFYCLPPLSPVSTGTVQLTFTTIGTWDAGRSGIGLDAARDALDREMGHYTNNLNLGRGLRACESIVREFTLYDLKHFVIEQRVTIKLLRGRDAWTIVVCSDAGSSLDESHRGPWTKIRDDHASSRDSVEFLPWPLDYTNRDMKRLLQAKNPPRPHAEAASASASSHDHSDAEGYEVPQVHAGSDGRNPMWQCLSYLPSHLGLTTDDPGLDGAQPTPFHALHTIFRLLAASENQYLNLMEEKVRLCGHEGEGAQGIYGIQLIKKHVDVHVERLRDVLDVIGERGGRGWTGPNTVAAAAAAAALGTTTSGSPSLPPPTEPPPAEEAAHHLHRTFQKLLQRAEAVSSGCRDEVATLSSAAVVREAQRSMRQTGAIAKVTFIASVFVPLSFTTSVFGMNLREFGERGVRYTTFVAVVVPVVVVSVLAWWVDRGKLRRAARWLGGGGRAEEEGEEGAAWDKR